jgi:hypothetical protein
MNLHIPDVRILEVHPPWSNLRHSCRLSSTLEERNHLGLPLLLHAVRDAADLGYNFLHVSGADPLRDPALPVLCREAHHHGMLTSTVTPSAALEAPHLEWLRFSIDLLGVKFQQSAAARDRLAAVRSSGIPFAIVFRLTAASLPGLESAAEFAVAQGAALLQVRPSGGLTSQQTATAWTMLESLRDRQRGRLVIHLDAVNRYCLPTEPEGLASWKRDVERQARYLGEIVSPLVIEQDGAVTPLRHGFPRRFAFGNLREERLAAMAGRWIAAQSGAFCGIYRTALEKARASDRMFSDLRRMVALEAGRGESGMPAAC